MKRECRSCNSMLGIRLDGSCNCRRLSVTAGIVSFSEHLVPYQPSGCPKWSKYREPKPFRQPGRLVVSGFHD